MIDPFTVMLGLAAARWLYRETRDAVRYVRKRRNRIK